jgi:hypothetical protein
MDRQVNNQLKAAIDTRTRRAQRWR